MSEMQVDKMVEMEARALRSAGYSVPSELEQARQKFDKAQAHVEELARTSLRIEREQDQARHTLEVAKAEYAQKLQDEQERLGD
jgi:multidrug resistance efflux pump